MRARPLRWLGPGLMVGVAWLGAGPGPALAGTAVTIGTGGETSVYYPAGNAICRLVSATHDGFGCAALSTNGSVANIEALRQGQLDLAIVQGDVEARAFEGEGDAFAGRGPFADLRAVFALHAEPFTLVARADAGIASLADLRGKRVNIGNPGSGQRATMTVLMQRLGWTLADFALATELTSTEQAQALADDKIDAMVFTVGHPNGSIQQATATVDARLVPVVGPEIDALVGAFPYYSKTIIPPHLYRGADQEVATFGVRAMLVTTARVPDEVVYQIVESVFGNFEVFTQLHPAFKDLNPKEMVSQARSVPLHPGAEAYYQRAGLM